MLIAVVTIFATLWLPHRGMLVYNTMAPLLGFPRYMDLWFLMFAKTCIYINRFGRICGYMIFDSTSIIIIIYCDLLRLIWVILLVY